LTQILGFSPDSRGKVDVGKRERDHRLAEAQNLSG
jgi:hypothetical protein